MAFDLYPVVFKPQHIRGAPRRNKAPLSLEPPKEQEAKDEEIAQLCYKNQAVGKRSLELARVFQKAFIEKYLNRISRVRLARGNIADHLLSIVSFRDGPQKEEIEAL